MKMQLLRSVALAMLALLCTLAGRSQTTDVHSQLWKITGKGLPAPSYLLGTHHAVGGSFVDSFPAIRRAFDASKVLIREALPVPATADYAAILEFPANDSLQRYMSPADFQTLTTFIRSKLTGDDTLLMARVPRLTPQAVNFLITELKGDDASGNATPTEPGMDDFLYDRARSQGKNVVALEDVIDQAKSIKASADLRQQAAQLARRISGSTGAADDAFQVNTMTVYRSRRIPHYFSYQQTQQFERAYGADRNLQWMQKLPALIEKGPAFIAVGHNHLVSSESLVLLLRKAGYTVTNVPL
ncbi:TraB/GumN family protein [Chitinophaga caseinilytica]|uniref:TraB/GumN family protein n=1 Tax=Chitinophaga caseinilytica TaxID=2267521 RepID=UPI003C2D958B